AEKVFIHVDSGTGSTFNERDFEGTGISEFDPRRGVELDSTLTETAPTPGVGRGSIGKITSLKGSIACGDQTPGSSTLTITGATLAGRYDVSRLDPVIVECYFASGQVTVIGIAHAGAASELLMISLRPDGLGVEEAP